MVKIWLAALAPLLEGHPHNFQFIKSVTYFILIASYHSHADTMVKYLQTALSGISSNIHLFLPYCKSRSMSEMPIINSVPHYIECIRDLGCAKHSETEMYESTDKNLFEDGYHSFNKVSYIPQMWQLERCLFHIKSRVHIQLHIVKTDLISPKADMCRKLLVGDSLASNTLAPSLMPRIKCVMCTHNTPASVIFPSGISI